MTNATTIVIFGASGDLTRRKLVPALYNLYLKHRLPDKLNIVGNSRTSFTHEAWRDRLKGGVQDFSADTYEESTWNKFSQHLWYIAGSASADADMGAFCDFLSEKEGGPANRLYYLSVAPDLYMPVITNIGHLCMADEDEGWRRVIIEKPFGTDLETARALNEHVHTVFEESQVYRIDHYLGKETAQNIMFLRFANAIFEPVWNRHYVDSVQITAIETVDVGHRGAYYDHSGVLRDMFQNHLLQLLTLISMEPPASFDADLMRNEKVKLLKSVRPIEMSDVVLGQYKGYRGSDGVAPDSRTPTYGAMKLYVDNGRWRGVPFFLRSGKGLKQKHTEIDVIFQASPHHLFKNPEKDFKPNALSICVQPDEGIHLTFEAKEPDVTRLTRSVDMEFHYATSFNDSSIPEAYERLLLDALLGDAGLFSRRDGIEAQWELMDPIIKAWEVDNNTDPLPYEEGSWGPEAAQKLLKDAGRDWMLSCEHDVED